MIKINIKPLSVNKCWQGRRFKTPDYKRYEKDLLLMLPNFDLEAVLEESNKLNLYIEFGLSNKGNDIDNGLKPFLDILQKKYGFNDSKIYKLVVIKEIVKKGSEYIMFNLEGFK